MPFRLLGAFVLLWGNLVLAAELPARDTVVLVQDDVEVTVGDVLASVSNMPPDRQAIVLSDPRTVEQLASRVLLWRNLAAHAAEEGLLESDAAADRLRLARERAAGELALEATEVGLTEDELLDIARAEYAANPEQFEREDQIRARHILVAFGEERDEAEALDKAQALRQRIEQGEDFAELAEAHSDDPGSGARGGDLGFFGKGQMVPAFEEAAFALEAPGDLSEPVRSRFGYHLILLEEKRPAGKISFDEARAELLQGASIAVMNMRREELVETMRDPERMTYDPEVIEQIVESAR